jgi:hypothetical protein
MLSEMQFKGVWRDYQARVLAEMDGHLADGRLHIVAAPGSGKTVLGLEAMRRIGRRTLVLAPSLTIRGQWRDRLFPLFLDDPHGWDAHISTGIDTPATLTIGTYQALHAGHAGGPGRFDALVSALDAEGPITLILDEAHHLRREWWTALFALRDRLRDPMLLALTATPPYDAPFAEWARYAALCGPIDSEIVVPELVRNGDLCPHQDYVHLSRPRHDEAELLVARRAAIEALVAGLLVDAALLDSLAAHPWLAEPEAHAEALLERPDYLTALMILLHAAGRPVPRAAADFLAVDDAVLPPFTSLWLERLFQGLIDEPQTLALLGDARSAELRRALGRLGLIESKRVALCENKAVFTAVAGSVAKLDSIVEIARAEAADLGERLRLVILSDRLRADGMPERADAPFAPAKLGVMPIFEALRRAGVLPDALAVLTGTRVILPATALAMLDAEAASLRIDPASLGRRPLPACPGHVALECEGDAAQATALVTRLFQRGAVRVLVGTQALLGEGWDAPAINSLILASNAGSYMLSNQMRGRAIRIDPADPDKVAAIWHLATIVPGDTDGAAQGDRALLGRRFAAFEGIANGPGREIASGMDRLALDFEAPERSNAETLARARDRSGIRDKWRSALGGGDARSHVRQIAELSHAPRALAWRDSLQALVFSGVSGGALSAAGALRHFLGTGGFGTLVLVFLGATFLYSLPQLGRAGLLWWRNGTLERSLAQVGETLLASLHHAGALAGDETRYAVIVRRSLAGRYTLLLDGATRAEERVFLDALAELLGPVQNPRYLLVRKSRLGRARRTDSHAVPTVLGARKAFAEHFQRQWRRRIGSSRLVYTRTGDGRRTLLRARVQSFSAGMQRFFERRSVWM